VKIVFESPWTRPDDGWSVSSRAYARCIALAGHDVRLLHPGGRPAEDPEVLAEIPAEMREPTRLWDAYTFSTPLGGPEQHRAAGTFEVLRRYAPPRFFYTMFERLEVQPELVAEMNQLDAVWVPSTCCIERLDEAGLECGLWVPFPHFPDDPYLPLPPPRREPREFLWVGRWERRKAPDKLIEAFVAAFQPGEARLTLKTSGRHARDPSYPTAEEVLAEITRGHWTAGAVAENIRVVPDRLSRAEMVAMMAEADVYCSASRGEGLDLPCYAAKLAGRTVVTTDSGGPRDFLGEGDELVPARGRLPLPEYAWLWGEGAEVADYELGDLVAALQRARSRAPRRSDMREFEAASVAKVLGRLFEEWA
jgi:glycosyltransferase involved in cell wall biosynthesis